MTASATLPKQGSRRGGASECPGPRGTTGIDHSVQDLLGTSGLAATDLRRRHTLVNLDAMAS
eukprot:12398830-Karenia_brevis.AAC.1